MTWELQRSDASAGLLLPRPTSGCGFDGLLPVRVTSLCHSCMKTTKMDAFQSCGSCRACLTYSRMSQSVVNPQCHRRHLRPRSGKSFNPVLAGLRPLGPANSKRTCPKRCSVVTNFTTAVRAEVASAEAPSDLPFTKVQGFAGLGAQRTLDFLAAWDQLALRLPPQAGMGKAAELILNALKLEVSHLPPQADPPAIQPSTAASTALAVATQLADLSGQGFPLDAESIAAGILVDAVAAQRLSLGVVDHRLGAAVANLIQDIIKVRRLPSRVDLYDDVASSALRELALTFYDTRAIVVEVVARLVGMRDPVGTPLYARQLAALEALQIYAPLGHGLGLRPLCAQLEDRCFQELFPESYTETAAWLRREVNANGDSLAVCEDRLQRAVEEDPQFQALAAGCQVAGRTKSLFSTMKKLLRLDSIETGGRARQEVHDILASRCMVTPHPDLPATQAEHLATQACYVVARVASQMYEEVSGRRKDYIAQPKENGYQSLHCTIKLPPVTVDLKGGKAGGQAGSGPEDCALQQGPTCELQIRTQRMHDLAESGGAAHAAYKGGLDSLQANRLQAWTHTLRALPPGVPHEEQRPQHWSNQAAAAEQLFSHLDRDGDGYISVEEVGVLLEELGVDAAGGEGKGQGNGHLQLPEPGAGQQLLSALANKQHSGVTFAEFLQFNSQASLLGALPRVDTETAQSLRRSTSFSQESSSGASPAVPAAPTSAQDNTAHAIDSSLGRVSHLNSGAASDSDSESGSEFKSPISTSAPYTSSPQYSGSCTHTGFRHVSVQNQPGGCDQHTHDRQTSWSGQQGPAQNCTASGYPAVLSIPHTGTAQSLSNAAFTASSSLASSSASFGRLAGYSRSAVACRCSSSFDSSSAVSHPRPAGRTSGQSWGRSRGRASGQSAMPGCGKAPHGFHMKQPHSSWKLHAVDFGQSTAETADPEVAISEMSSGDELDAERRSSHDQATTSSQSSLDSSSLNGDSALLSTKHNESTLSLDLSDLPEPSSSSLPKPHPTTRQPDSQSDEQSSPQQAYGTSPLLSSKLNEKTVSLDLDDLPIPPALVRPQPPPPSLYQKAQQPQAPSTSRPAPLDWDHLSPQSPPPGSAGDTQGSPGQSPARTENGMWSEKQKVTGSWDNLQPLFRPPSRVEPPREPQEPPNESAAADLLFSSIQSKRYKHEKGTSYKSATFALVPIDRKVGWRLQCDDEVIVAQPLHLPQHGPLLLGGGDPRQAACDVVLEGAVEAGSGVHARLEIFWSGRKPCCLVTCLAPYGTTFLNRVKLPRMVDTECYLGDILSFGELTMAFQFVPVLVPERQQSALENALHYAKGIADGRVGPKEYDVISRTVRQMSRHNKFAQARVLMANHLVKSPINSEGWAQLANMERRMAKVRLQDATVCAARCYYRAAAELIQHSLDANASPNGEAKPGSQQHMQLMKAVSSFIRVLSSWAQMEFHHRHDTSARRLYRRALSAVPKDPPLQGKELQQPVKLLFKWAHQEFTGDNLFQARELLQALLQLEPSNTRALGLLGSLEWQGGKLKLAREYMLAAIKAAPSHVANLHTLARLDLEEGRLQEAKKLFAEGLRLEPNNAYILQSWALAEAAEGNTERARDMLKRATSVQPRSVPCWHAWAKLEVTNGNMDKARELYLKALQLDPRGTVTYSALGTLERKAHNLDMALSYLEKALELTPRHQAACVEMAIVLRKLGREEQAVKFSDKAIKERTARKYKHSHVKQDGQVKHANEFVRSSELQQDARRERLKKEAASEAKKAAATQKGNKTEANRRARHRRQKKKQALKAQMQIAGQPQEAPIERVVSTQM